MRLLTVTAVLAALSGCVDFNAAYEQCQTEGHRCFDAGTVSTPCEGCLGSSGCVPFAVQTGAACGAGGAACVDCAALGKGCEASVHACRKWLRVHSDANHRALSSAIAVAPGQAYFGSADVTTLLSTADEGAHFTEVQASLATTSLAVVVFDAGVRTVIAAGDGVAEGRATLIDDPPGATRPDAGFSQPDIVLAAAWSAGPEAYVGGWKKTSGKPPMAIFQWQGASWVEVTPLTVVQGIFGGWGAGAGDYYVIHGNYFVGHRTPNGLYAEVDLGNVVLTSLWGTSPSRVWVAGERGYLAKVVGTTVSVVPQGGLDTSAWTWSGLYAADDAHVFVVGTDGACGTAATLSGGVLSPECVAPGIKLLAVTGTSADDVWATDEKGSIYRLAH